jgi:hypothetical protein
VSDRIGLAFAWALGLFFCALTAAIVIYLLVEGLKYVSPHLFVTHPTADRNRDRCADRHGHRAAGRNRDRGLAE